MLCLLFFVRFFSVLFYLLCFAQLNLFCSVCSFLFGFARFCSICFVLLSFVLFRFAQFCPVVVLLCPVLYLAVYTLNSSGGGWGGGLRALAEQEANDWDDDGAS